jgi:hypothetical protein
MIQAEVFRHFQYPTVPLRSKLPETLRDHLLNKQ